MREVPLRQAQRHSFGLPFFVEPMARPIIIYQVFDAESNQSGQGARRVTLATVSQEEIAIGREPPAGGLAIASNAVSRVHGLLRGVGQHWMFRDEGSTNGSWINGTKLPQKEWALLKPGDFLQLGDTALEIALADPNDRASVGVRSLLVFSRGFFETEFPVPEFGRALVVGGQKADLPLDVDVHDLPSLVIERRGDSVAAFTISKEVAVLVNGQELVQTKILKDRDELQVDHYRILFSDLTTARAGADSDFGDGAAYRRPVGGNAPGRSLIGQGPAGDPRAAPPGQSAIEASAAGTLHGAALTRARTPEELSAARKSEAAQQIGDLDWDRSGEAGAKSANGSMEGEQQGLESDAASTGPGVSGGSEVSGRRDPTRSFPWASDEAQEIEDGNVAPVHRSPERLPFGKLSSLNEAGVDQTVAIDPALIKAGGFGVGTRGRYGEPMNEEEALTSFEDKIWLVLGLLMVLALIAMVVWWLLSRGE